MSIPGLSIRHFIFSFSSEEEEKDEEEEKRRRRNRGGGGRGAGGGRGGGEGGEVEEEEEEEAEEEEEEENLVVGGQDNTNSSNKLYMHVRLFPFLITFCVVLFWQTIVQLGGGGGLKLSFNNFELAVYRKPESQDPLVLIPSLVRGNTKETNCVWCTDKKEIKNLKMKFVGKNSTFHC